MVGRSRDHHVSATLGQFHQGQGNGGELLDILQDAVFLELHGFLGPGATQLHGGDFALEIILALDVSISSLRMAMEMPAFM